MKKLLLLAFVLVCVGCEDNTQFNPKGPIAASKVINYGNGIYYFPYKGRDFPQVLEAYSTDNELEIVSITGGDGIGPQGYGGHYVIMKKKGGL